MKKTFSFLGLLCLAFSPQIFACTTFFLDKNGQLVFGRNYDWITDAGMVCTNLKGLDKTSMKQGDGKTIHWISKYGSITFNQFGKELPTGGMNENGLVVEMMWADGSKYPAPDDRASLQVTQWVQYQLDNYSTVEEVVASDKIIRISNYNPPLHYLVADAGGNVATIEFLDGKMVVHRGKDLPFPVLTNSSYDQSAKTANEAKVLSGNTSFNFQDNSLQRFTKACSMVNQFQKTDVNKPVVDFAFEVLENVAQKEFTKWSIVYDLKNKKIYFKTASYPDTKSLSFSSFDFTCASGAKVIDMNQAMKGEIDKNFEPFSEKLNRTVMYRAADESKSQIQISEEARESNIAYANGITCKK